MYAADVDGQRLNFAVSGMLWKRSLVMRDDETESLWSHILGKCMDGKLKGTELEVLPSLMTDWKSWKSMHPKSTAVFMTRTAKSFNREMYKNPERFLVGLTSGKKSKAWTFDLLAKHNVLNDQWKEKPIVVQLEQPSFSSTIFSRKLDDQVLTFAKKGKAIVDLETQSTWNLQVGLATDGKLKGKQLRQLRSIPSFTAAWKKFHPESEYGTK